MASCKNRILYNSGQVCLPTSENSCHEEEKTSCSLVPDVVCRNVTQTRFDEKCWTVEEELCRTVYDTVWDKKCETVNITVPQTECATIQELVMEMECKVVNETVKNPVCVTVIEQEVEVVTDAEPEAEAEGSHSSSNLSEAGLPDPEHPYVGPNSSGDDPFCTCPGGRCRWYGERRNNTE